MQTHWKDLTLDLVEEGRLESDFNDLLRKLQSHLLAHAQRYGSKASGAKGRVSLDLELKLHDVDDKPDFVECDVVGRIKLKLPERPAAQTLAVSAEARDGTPVFQCRASGTTPDTPRQQVFATLDGRAVDKETGEVLDDEDLDG